MPISVEYLVVGGGGGGGSDQGGGGGGGGVLTGTASKAYDTTYTITVGNGGTGGNYPTDGTNGGDSVFDTVTATGGGRGQTETKTVGNGGSGGGGNGGPGLQNGGTGTSGQGYAGGNGGGVNPNNYGRGGGGGGAGGAGSAGGTTGGNGGNGVASSITGTSVTYGGGGGGGSLNTANGGTGGTGGGGAGGNTKDNAGTAGTDGLGGGGGGASNDTGGTHEAGGNGGKGVVILRFLTADSKTPTTTGSPTITTDGLYKVYKFTSSGTISFSDPNASVSSTVTDIDVNGKTVTVTVGADKTINALVSDTDITAGTNNLIINTSITIDVTNINIDAQDAIVNAGSDVLINAVVSNINIISGNNDYNIEPLIASGSTNIGIEAHSAIIQSDTNRTIESELPEITIDAKDVTLIINSTITVTKSDIQIDGKDVNELYPTLILSKNPVHYYRFIEQANPATIKDYGSLPYDGTATNIDSSDYETGIVGDPISKSILFNGFTTSGTEGVNFYPNKPLDRTSPNITLEFWIKTSSEDVPFYTADANNFTLSGLLYGGQTSGAWKHLGLRSGYFGITFEVSVQKPQEKRGALSDAYLSDGKWHHIVLTKKTTGSTITYNSYVDNQATNIVISLGDFLDVDRPRQSLMAINDDSLNFIQKYNHSTYLDELAIYDVALTEQEINDHFISGGGSQAVTVSANSTNININGQSNITLTSIINPQVSNIGIESHLPSVSDSNNRIIAAPISNISIESHLPSISINGSILIPVNKTNIIIIGKNNQEVVKETDIKFIPIYDTNISANDADELESINFGGLLYNQTKIMAFKLGNTRNNTCNFILRIISLESSILPAISLSYDKINFDTILNIEGVLANSITDPIYINFNTNEIDLLGSGTFLVDVEQNNA